MGVFRGVKKGYEIQRVREHHVLVDTGYLLNLADSKLPPKKWLEYLLYKGAIVHVPGEVLEEFQKYTKNPKLSKQVVEIVNTIREWSARHPGEVMIWEKEPSSILEESKRKWGQKLAEIDKKGNRRIGNGDAAILNLFNLLRELYGYINVRIATSDSDLIQLGGRLRLGTV